MCVFIWPTFGLPKHIVQTSPVINISTQKTTTLKTNNGKKERKRQEDGDKVSSDKGWKANVQAVKRSECSKESERGEEERMGER